MANESMFIQGGVSATNGTPSGTYLFDGTNYYYFSTVTREGFVGSSTTTDHYCENGSVIQDHVVDHPWTYTLTGLIGEKVHEYSGEPSPAKYLVRVRTQDVLKKIQTFGQVMPEFSSYVYSAINTGRFVANRVTSLIKTVQSILGFSGVTDTVRDAFQKMPNSLTGIWGLTKDETKTRNKDTWNNYAYSSMSSKKQYLVHNEQSYWAMKFEEARLAHTLFELHCPYGIAQNMLIESVDFSQDKYWTTSNVTVRLKQVRFVGISESILSQEKTDNELQTEPMKELGKLETITNDAINIKTDSDGLQYYINKDGMEVYIK